MRDKYLKRFVNVTRRVFKSGRAPMGLLALLFILAIGVYLADIWSSALIAVRQLLFVVAVLAGATRNLWGAIFFAVLSAFLHVQAFREYVPHPEDFTDLHYIVNFVIAVVPYTLAAYLGAFFMAFFVDDETDSLSKRREDGRSK